MGEHATLLRRGGTGGGGVGEHVKLLLDERADDGLVERGDDGLVERGDDGLVEMVIHARGRVGVVVEHGGLLHVSDSVMESWFMSQFLSGTSKLHVFLLFSSFCHSRPHNNDTTFLLLCTNRNKNVYVHMSMTM